jgi:hypothetical protein
MPYAAQRPLLARSGPPPRDDGRWRLYTLLKTGSASRAAKSLEASLVLFRLTKVKVP